jgi:hypothetical protein
MTTTTGQPRSTVSQVYAQIDSDIDHAIELLAKSPAQRHPSHMSYAVALGIKSRICLVEEKWDAALDAAQKAIAASGKSIQTVDASAFAPNKANFINSVGQGNVMWGAQIVSDQAGMYASLMTHMSGTAPYGQRAPKQISAWLYGKMSATDSRRAWWNPNDPANGENGYQQEKFKFVNYQTWEGDYVLMRIEEMYLVKAEAECMLGQEENATIADIYIIRYRRNRRIFAAK